LFPRSRNEEYWASSAVCYDIIIIGIVLLLLFVSGERF